MTEPEEKSAIERFKEGLYRQKEPSKSTPPGFYEKEFQVPEEWNGGVVVGEGETPALLPTERFSRFFTMKKLFISSLIFFSVAAAFFLFLLLRGSNIVFPPNVSLLPG